MITDLKTLEGCTLCAADGEIGAVQDFYFDDQHWHLRYFVADVGAWLKTRRVLISPEVVGEPHWGEELLPVKLTKDEIRHSPDIDTARPIERQHEVALRQHYGWPPYWGNIYADEPIDLSLPEPVNAKSEADRHLHSARHLLGYRMEAIDGPIGHVDNFLIEDASWRVCYMVADTRNWWPHKKVILAPGWIHNFNRDERKVVVDLSRRQIEGSPVYDSSRPLRPEYTEQLHEHYGRSHYPDWDAAPSDPILRQTSGTQIN